MVTKQSIIEKYWPKPSQCDVSNVKGMQEAIGKMMDEWSANQSILFLEYQRRYRFEEGIKFRKECDRVGGMFSYIGTDTKKVYEMFTNGEPIKSVSMPGVEYNPPSMTPTIDGNTI